MPLELLPSRLDGPLLLAPRVFGDERGFFAETFREEWLAEHGVTDHWIQDNHSRSSFGVVRGLHFQIGDGCAKLVRCGRGSIVDVLCDLRHGSPTFGEWEAFTLTDENLQVLYVPRGFGHGFCVTSPVADVLYKQDRYYSAEVERGIKFDDPAIGVRWPVPREHQVFSQRDAEAPTLAEFADQLPFRYAA